MFNSLVRSPRAGEAYLLYDAQTMDEGANARMMIEVMEAGNWTDFRRALENFYSPQVARVTPAGRCDCRSCSGATASSRSRISSA